MHREVIFKTTEPYYIDIIDNLRRSNVNMTRLFFDFLEAQTENEKIIELIACD
jgi:hypothetical protein